MPHIRGTELAKLLTELRPEMCVVLISGYSEDALLENRMLAAGSTILLQKPFDPEELVRGIRESLRSKPYPSGDPVDLASRLRAAARDAASLQRHPTIFVDHRMGNGMQWLRISGEASEMFNRGHVGTV
jgi:FixJ family two-component response regulator